MPGDSEEFRGRISDRAYFLWLEAGRPDGLADGFWHAARQMEKAPESPSNIADVQWFRFDASIVKDDNAKIMLERADALIKTQDDGMRAMESRMTSLLSLAVTLASAAIAATVTVIGSSKRPPEWVQPWTVPALCTLTAFWLAAVGTGAVAMMGTVWTTPGVAPSALYRPDYLSRNANRLRMSIARTLQLAIDANGKVAAAYRRRLIAMIALLAFGPVCSIAAALWVSRPVWLPILIAYLVHPT
jgi:hypothetical protein